MIVRELIAALDEKFPFARAASWDRTGLQIGDANATIERVGIAHELTQSTLSAARGCDALVVYHPPIFRALDSLDFGNHTVRLAAGCIAQNLNVIAVHTALDHAAPPAALGDSLAREIGLENIEVLSPAGREELCKIVVFVPSSHFESVREAMWNAGGGNIGNYDRASFSTEGQGTFRPLASANPSVGAIGEDSTEAEWRLEIIAPVARREAVVRAMKEAHVYEEVAHDIYPLHNSVAPYGSARCGAVMQSTLSDFAATIGETLGAPNLRIVRAKETVRRVACVPGSGASFIELASRAGCDCLVTGDIKHHDALQAQALGLSLVDVTHVATERGAVGLIAAALQNVPAEIVRLEIETNPFESV